ncbi:uncharacterized protein [Apostichopus japonicus]|uniref:uncharacterized protein isoform X3 n=1 Tax=Stichopus japonicus TaxID=307972 RepID=UPI003AB39F2C
MDSGKLRALTNFVNAINIGPCIESLKQLHDGSHFIEMMKILNGSQASHDADHPIQRYRYILNFLEEFYNTHLKFYIDCSRIINTADEFELAKVASLMLCASVQGDEDKRKLFVEPITKLDLTSQHEIKDIIEFVLNMESNSNQLRRNFADVLHRRVSGISSSPVTRSLHFKYSRGDSVSSDSSSTSLNDSSNKLKTPVEPASPFQRVYQGSPISPVKVLLTSPHMANKINLRKMHHKIRELETKNASERALRDDVESEVLEKSKRIADLESQMRDLNNQLQGSKDLQDKLDEFQAREEEFNSDKSQLQKMKMKLSELGDMKEEYSRLDKEMKDLTSERTKLHSSLGGYQRLKGEHEEVQKSLRQANREIDQLKATIEKVNEDLMVSESKYSEAEQMLQQSRQIYKEKIEHLEVQLSSNNASPLLGESLGMITEKRIADLEDELNELRSTWTEPKANQALKDELSQMTQIRGKFEASFKETKALLIKSENDCGRLREDLEDKTKTIGMLTDARDMLNQKVTEFEITHDKVQNELREMSNSVSDLEEQLAQTSHEKRELQDVLNNAKSDQALQLQEFRAHQSAWEAQRTMFEDNERNLKDQQRKLEDEVSNHKREIETVSSDLKGKLAVSSSKLKSLEALLEQERWASNEKLSALREEIIAVRRESEEAAIKLQGRLESSQHLLISVRSESEKVQDEFQRATKESEAAMTKAEAEKQSLAESVKSERALVRSIQESHQLERQSWEKTRQDLKDSICKLKEVQSQEKISSQEKATALENEISLLKVDLERASSSKETLRASLQSQKRELLAENENIVQGMENKLAEVMKQLQESREDVSQAQAELASHRESFVKRLAEAKEESKQTESSLIECHRSEIKQLEQARGKIKTELQQFQERQKEERQSLEEKIVELESKHSSINVDLERTKQENVALRNSLVSDKQEMFAERGRMAKEMESKEDDLRRELTEVKQSLNAARSDVISQKEKIEKEIIQLKEEHNEKEKGLKEAYQSEVGRVTEANKDLKNLLDQQLSAQEEERKQSKELNCKTKIKLDSLQEALQKEQAEKTSLQEALNRRRREMTSDLERVSQECQEREDELRKDLLETKQGLSKAQSEVVVLQENLNTREKELLEELERKENDRLVQQSEEEKSRKTWTEKELLMAEEAERLKLEIQKLEATISDKDRMMIDEKARLKNESYQREAVKERLEEEADHLRSQVEDKDRKIGVLDASLEKVTMEKKKIDMDLLHIKEDSQLKALKLEETVSKLEGDLNTARGELQRSSEEYRAKLSQMMSDMENSHGRERTNAELLAERQRVFETEIEKLKRDRAESERKLQERVKASVKQVEELTSNLREATAIAEESSQNLNTALTEKMELEAKLHEDSRVSREEILDLQSKLEGQRQDSEEERMKLRTVNDDLRTKLMTLEQQQERLQQSSGKVEQKLKVEQSTRTKEVEVLRLEKQFVEEKYAALEKEFEALKCEKLQTTERLTSREKEAEMVRSEKQQLEDQQGSHEEEIITLRSEKQQLIERMNKLVEMNKRIKESEKREVGEKKEDLEKYKREVETELGEIRERYEKEIDMLKRGEQAKQKLLQQELDAVASELEHTKLMLSHETDALEEKSKLALSASESLKSSKMETEKEITSLRKTMDKEKRDNNKRLEKLKQELLAVKTESCSLQRKIEEETQQKIAKAEKTSEREKMELETKIQVLVQENEGLKKQMTRLERNTEPVERCDLEHSSLELSNADLQTSVRRAGDSKLASDSLAEDSDADISAADSLNDGTPAQKLGRNLSEMRLDDLDISPRASLTSSQGSTKSLRSNTSTISKGRTTIEITMSCTRSQVDLTTSVPAHNPTTPYNLRSSTTSNQLDLPERVTKTLDELCASQSSLTASSIQGKSHHTTGRANFVIVNDCDEEPEFLAWEDRIQELHRRNTLCRPHLKTSYPVETQTYAPDNFDDNDLKVKETTFSEGESKTVVTTSGRTSRKRKTDLAQIDEAPSGKQLRKATSENVLPGQELTSNFLQRAISHQEMPPPDTSTISRTTRPSQNDLSDSRKLVATNTNSTGRILRSSDIRTNAENKPQPMQPTKPDQKALSFDIGFSPKPSLRRRSMRHSFARKALGRNSPKVNPEVAAARKENKLKSKKETSKVPKMDLTKETSQSKLPTGLPTTAKKSKRRSIGKWLGK